MVPLNEELDAANEQIVETGGYQKQSQWRRGGILRTEDAGQRHE